MYGSTRRRSAATDRCIAGACESRLIFIRRLARPPLHALLGRIAAAVRGGVRAVGAKSLHLRHASHPHRHAAVGGEARPRLRLAGDVAQRSWLLELLAASRSALLPRWRRGARGSPPLAASV